jgi:hypothetical protein
MLRPVEYDNSPGLEAALDEQMLEAKIAEEERLAEEHARRAEGWRLILRGRRFLSDDVAIREGAIRATSNVTGSLSGPSSNGDKPRTNNEAVLQVMASKPTKTWSASEIMGALDERGWTFGGKTPRKTLGATLSILTKKEKLQRAGRGRYRIVLGPIDRNTLFEEQRE